MDHHCYDSDSSSDFEESSHISRLEWNSMVACDNNDIVTRACKDIIPANDPSYVRDYKMSIIRSAYDYGMCIKHRGYDLSWKHAEKIFYDHWYREDRVVEWCVHGKREYLERAARRKMALDSGMDSYTASIVSISKDDIAINAATRYGTLMDIKNMASIEYKDGMHRWSFKDRLYEDPVWKDIMRRCDRHFHTHMMYNNECHPSMWHKMSKMLTKEYGIMHTVVYGQNVVYSFGDNDTLVDVG